MNEHNNNDGQMEETMTDAKNPWNADLNDPYLGLKLASKRLFSRQVDVTHINHLRRPSHPRVFT